MRYWLLALTLLILPLATADGWYYAGDTFEEDGMFYSVEGSGYESVLLGVDGQLYLIPYEECKIVGFTTYCYDDSGYPDDEDHIKYAAGERYFGYHISISTKEPKAKMTRSIDDSSPEISKQATLTVTMENTGDYQVRDITFTETLPDGLKMKSGPGTTRKVDFTLPLLDPKQKHSFTYQVAAESYGSFTLSPQASYRYKETISELAMPNITIEIDTPLKIDSAASSSIGIDEDGSYEINLTNEAQSDSMSNELAITLPEGLTILDTGELGDDLKASFDLAAGETASYMITFYGATGGTHKVRSEIISSITGSEFENSDSRDVKVTAEGIEPSLQLSSSKTSYPPGSELTLTTKLENKNANTRFESIKGTITSDLFETERFDLEGMSSNSIRTPAQFRFTLPPVNESTDFEITMEGTYKTPKKRILEFKKSVSITVAPVHDVVSIKREVEPFSPKLGENLTIRVSVENLYGQYATITAYEKLPPEIAKMAGILYKETSLETDSSEKLYEYIINVPANYSGNAFTLTTLVQTQGEDIPQEFTTDVFIQAEDEIEVEPIVAEVEEVVEPESKEELGFFAAMWDFFKGLFD